MLGCRPSTKNAKRGWWLIIERVSYCLPFPVYDVLTLEMYGRLASNGDERSVSGGYHLPRFEDYRASGIATITSTARDGPPLQWLCLRLAPLANVDHAKPHHNLAIPPRKV